MFISFDRTALLTSGNLSYRYISTRAKLGTRIFVVALLKIANPHDTRKSLSKDCVK